MSSTDSAGNARGPSCNLVSSLLPSSCRGSAEAFARCLHRRLTSLGGENGSPERSGDAAKPHETTWLHPSSSNHVSSQHPILQHQPRHSPESDLFFEVEEEEEEEEEEDGPESPAEEATAVELAHLLVNPGILKKASHHDACHCSPSGVRTTGTVVASAHQDPESGCVFASPITGTPPDSDSLEAFFDPAESSDAEKPKMEAFFDPISTSDSETTSNLSNNSVPARSRVALSGRRRTDVNPERREDTSESSCSLRRNPPPSHENGYRQEDQVCSSEDSLNGRSSQETTSPSHESLWSTFDDSTVSLQDESPQKINHDPVIPHVCLPKSHSDSELPCNGIGTVMSSKLDRRTEEKEEERDECDFVSEGVTHGNGSLCNANGDDLTKDESLVEDEEESTESERASSKSLSQLKAEDAVSDTDTDYSAYGSAVDIPNAVVSECSNGAIETTSRSELKLQIDNDNGEALNDSDDEERRLCLLLHKLGGDSADAKEEEDSSPEQETQSETTVEEEEDRPQRVRRCSSLKTGKTPPGTPRRKKIVRFADKLGLDLADVRTFLDEIPRIPNSAYSDLAYDDMFRPQHSSSSEHATTVAGDDHWCERYQDDVSRRRSLSAIPTRKIDRTLMPLFQQPGGMGNFLDLVRERRVCLENALVRDPVTLAIQGTVRVINLDFHKSVHVRYTLDAWRNFSDLQATYVPNSCDGFSDKFSFVLYCHTLSIGNRLEFAVRFQCKGAQYWDNNAGVNYCFQCLPASSSSSSARSYIPITADENRRSSWSPLFY
ncbi:glycogen-binding subunit 76A isoform X2 [Linepithema humile]